MKRLDCVPVKRMLDWRALADIAKEHGAVLLPLGAIPDNNTAHASLHRFGMGVYQAQNEAGEIVGWRVAPLIRKNKARK